MNYDFMSGFKIPIGRGRNGQAVKCLNLKGAGYEGS